jgi:hypothetical protein
MPNTKSAKSSTRNGARKTTTTPDSQPVGGFKLKPAAQYIGGLSVPTMHRLIQCGLLKPNRNLRHLIFSKAELDRFLST